MLKKKNFVLSKVKNCFIFNFISSRPLLETRSVHVTPMRNTESLSTISR